MKRDDQRPLPQNPTGGRTPAFRPEAPSRPRAFPQGGEAPAPRPNERISQRMPAPPRQGAGGRQAPAAPPRRAEHFASQRPSPPPFSAPAPPPSDPAAAARRAAEYAKQVSGISNQAYPPGGYPPYTDQLPENNRFVDDFFTESDSPGLRSSSHRGFLLGAVIAAIILVLISIFFLFKSFSRRNEVRLAKRETSATSSYTSSRPSATTSESTTRKPTESTTLTPLGTDPYQNLPAWTPPTAPPTLPPEQTAAPPVVNQVTDLPTAPPEIPQDNPNGAAGNESQGSDTPASDPGAAAQDPQNVAVNLPSMPEGVAAASPSPERPELMMRTEEGGVLSDERAGILLGSLASKYTDMYISPNGRFFIGRSRESGYFHLLDLNNLDLQNLNGFELSMLAPQKIGQLIGNTGLGYITDGQLFHVQYETGDITLISPDVQDALFADEADAFLVKRNNGVYLIPTHLSEVELLAPGQVIGDLKLLSISLDGTFAAFEDDKTVYFYQNTDGNASVHMMSRVGEKQAQLHYNSLEREGVIFEPDSNVITRFDGHDITQVQLDQGTLSEDALVLPIGNHTTGPYARLAIYSNGTLYLSNEQMNFDAQNGFYYAKSLFNGLGYICAGGDALYFTDENGGLYVLDSSAVTMEGTADATRLASSGTSEITSSADGSAIYYIQNGELWRRLSGYPAERVSSDCSAYFMNPDGSRIFVLTSQGGLLRIANGTASELMPGGSGLSRENFATNPLVQAGGNTWLAGGNFVWTVDGKSYVEP